MPFMERLLDSDPNLPYEKMTDLGPEMLSAVMTCHGSLTMPFEYIWNLRKENEASTKSFLLLGAGLVAGPCVNYICRNPKNRITIVDIDVKVSQKLASQYQNASVGECDIRDSGEAEKIISKHSIVISLLPAQFNILVGKLCLKLGKHLVTASYISEELRKLHDEAKDRGLLFLNEVGLDPGIDHLEAVRIIRDTHQKGGKIKSFVSWCGGLPLPEFSDNPLSYKFSWNPRGFLNACLHDAKYLLEGQVIQLPNSRLFKNAQPVDLFPGFNLEGYANRDSLSYMKEYGIENEVQTMFRGTLRYSGTSRLMDSFLFLGLLNDKSQPFLSPQAPSITWNMALKRLLGIPPDEDLKKNLKKILKTPQGFPDKGFSKSTIARTVDCLEWLGLLGSE